MATRCTTLLIMGTGPAGCTAAIHAARANLKPILVTGLVPGGQLATTTEVENYPGFRKGVQGPVLMEELRQQAERCGTRVTYDTITAIDLTKSSRRRHC